MSLSTHTGTHESRLGIENVGINLNVYNSEMGFCVLVSRAVECRKHPFFPSAKNGAYRFIRVLCEAWKMGCRSIQLHKCRVMRFIFIFRFLFVYPFWHLLDARVDVGVYMLWSCGVQDANESMEKRERERQTEVNNINIHRNLIRSVNICYSWTSRLTYAVRR